MLVALTALTALAPPWFGIRVVDAETGRGVPLVELRTVHDTVWVTDSAGWVAFHEPGLMDREVWFGVTSHGYELPADGFGYRGVRLLTTTGGAATIRLPRRNVAERLYRLTGGGIYRDSLLLGQPAPLREPVLNGQVLGQDSVLCVPYHGRLYWFWGDTNRPGYPLGNFHVPGATSLLPDDGGLDPAVGVDLEYFLDEHGAAKATCRLPGEGPTWIGGVTVLGDRMFAGYAKIRPPLTTYERGLVEWDDAAHEWRKVTTWDLAAPLWLRGHPMRWQTGGRDWVLGGDGLPLVRVSADAAALADTRRYEAFTCLAPGSRADGLVEHDAAGQAVWGWKPATTEVGPATQAELLKQGRLRPEEAWYHLQEADSGRPFRAHHGAARYSPYRGRWVLVVTEQFGTSALGEIWYAEADTPAGPWVYARQVLTHQRYSFYNPCLHPELDQEGGRWLYFEGTYTRTFAGNEQPTPRYDYNQIMYRLDLADPRLNLPVPLYRTAAGPRTLRDAPTAPGSPVIGFVLDHPRSDAVPLTEVAGRLQEGANGPVVGWVLPADAAQPPATTVTLHEWTAPDQPAWYGVDGQAAPAGYRRAPQPLCRLWRSPREAWVSGPA